MTRYSLMNFTTRYIPVSTGEPEQAYGGLRGEPARYKASTNNRHGRPPFAPRKKYRPDISRASTSCEASEVHKAWQLFFNWIKNIYFKKAGVTCVSEAWTTCAQHSFSSLKPEGRRLMLIVTSIYTFLFLAGECGPGARCPSGCQKIIALVLHHRYTYRSYSSHTSFTNSIEMPVAGWAITLQLTDSNISSNNAFAFASLRSAILILTSTGALNRFVSNQYSISCFCCCIMIKFKYAARNRERIFRGKGGTIFFYSLIVYSFKKNIAPIHFTLASKNSAHLLLHACLGFVISEDGTSV